MRRMHWMALILLAGLFAQGQSRPVSPAGYSISGIVVSAQGEQPLPHMQVMVGHAEAQGALHAVVSGDDGRFQFTGLPAGKYWLAAEGIGFARQNFDEHEGFFTGIVVGPNIDSAGLVFRVRPDCSIAGSVTDDLNDPVRQAQVMLFRRGVVNGKQGTTQQTGAVTDAAGHYRFSHLRPGTYFVAVSTQPWYAQNQQATTQVTEQVAAQVAASGSSDVGRGEERLATEERPAPELDVTYPVTFYSGTTETADATPLDLKSGDRVTADLTLTPVPAVRLRVDYSGLNAESASATLVRRLFDFQEQVAAGTTEIHDKEVELSGVAPGRYELTVSTFGKTSRQWTQTVDVAGDTRVSARRGSGPVAVSGVVKTDGGMVIPARAQVTLRSIVSGDVVSATIAASGEFQFGESSMRPSKYEVQVLNFRDALVSSVTAANYKVDNQSVEITGAGVVRLVVTVSQRLGNVDGIARHDGKPVAGAMVVLAPRDLTATTRFRRDQSDSDGSFSLRGALPGKYTVVAIENGWDVEWLNPAVMKTYLKDGIDIEVTPQGKYKVEAKVQ